MQKLILPGLICRIRGVDQKGHRILQELRKHQLKRVIFLPLLLSQWNKRFDNWSRNTGSREEAEKAGDEETVSEPQTGSREETEKDPVAAEDSGNETASMTGSGHEGDALPSGAKEGLRLALGAYWKRKLMQSEDPIIVKKLKTKKKLFTVLKGPHIDKKAREQFFFTTYGVELSIRTRTMPDMMFMETLMRFYETGINELQITARF